MDDIITKRLHISGLTPAITVSDLQKRLSTFGEVKSLDGFGLLDGLGNPRKFGYVDLETTKGKLARCLNLLSGSTWKGAKLRIGEAKPDYRQRLAVERAEAEKMESHPRKRRRVQAVEAPDMSLVTPENAKTRSGWKLTPTGRLIRPMKMRPLRPLGPTLDEINVKPKVTATLKTKEKGKTLDVRARRRLIDPVQWGSTQLRGVFLETHSNFATENAKSRLHESPEPLDANSETDEEEAKSTTLEKTPPPAIDDAIIPASSIPTPPRVESPIDATATGDILEEEKDRTLSLLNSLFAGDDWGGQESLSDVEDDRARITVPVDEEYEIEEVPMDTAVARAESPVATAPEAETEKARAGPQSLKDLFAPKQSEGGFTLLGHLDLDMDLDEEVPFNLGLLPSAAEPEPVSIPTPIPHAVITDQTFTFVVDPKAPLFFPLPSSFTPSDKTGGDMKHKDLFNVALEGGWDWRGFHRTESEGEIRRKWESEKGELTRTWKKRWREAGKARKRVGGGHDD